MSTTVSDFIIDRLIDSGLHRYYGFPGDGIGGFDAALERAERAGGNFRYIRPTHEEIASFMATAHSKFTGELGVCIATSGPGAIHLLNGLYDARQDHQGVLAIVGQQARVSLGSDFQQQIDLERVFQDVAGYVETVTTPMQAQMVLDRAIRVATAEKCPCVVVLPADVQNLEMEKPTAEHFVARTGRGAPSTRFLPPLDEIDRAAAVLNAGKKVAMLVGAGAAGATDEVLAVADTLGAGVITSLLGKDVVPGDVPFHTQQAGLLGSRPSHDLMRDCDTFFMIGSNYPYTEFLPDTGQARGVQIDLSPENLSLRYPMEVELLGDAKSTLSVLADRLEYKTDRSWQDGVIEGVREWDEVMNSLAEVEGDPVNPRYVYTELNERLPENAIVTADAGSTADWYGNHIKLGRNMMGNLSGSMASMLASMPYAVSAKFAHSDRPVICTIGDGAFQMLGMNEMITVKRHWKEWADPRFIVLVLHNNDLNQVSWEMREAGDPRWDTSQLLEDVDYAAYAELLGFTGIRVEEKSAVGPAWDAALASDKPVLIDVVTDPNMPPLPPHVTFEQAKGMAEALLKGDPDEARVIAQTARSVTSELLAKAKNVFTSSDGGDVHR